MDSRALALAVYLWGASHSGHAPHLPDTSGHHMAIEMDSEQRTNVRHLLTSVVGKVARKREGKLCKLGKR